MTTTPDDKTVLRARLEALVRDRVDQIAKKKIIVTNLNRKLEENDEAISRCLLELDDLTKPQAVLPLFAESE
jgi:hypothetical protein